MDDQALAHSKTYDDLVGEGKTPEDIIESAIRANPGMDACTGLYDEYFETYRGGINVGYYRKKSV